MTIPVVRAHPYGGYAVVQMEHEAAGAPAVIPGYHDLIGTFKEACRAAEAEETEHAYVIHPECR